MTEKYNLNYAGRNFLILRCRKAIPVYMIWPELYVHYNSLSYALSSLHCMSALTIKENSALFNCLECPLEDRDKCLLFCDTSANLTPSKVSFPSQTPKSYWLCTCWSESTFALSCPTLCNPMDCSLPGSSIHGIFQARVLEWIAISFSNLC